MSTFKLGAKSLKELEGVHAELAAVVKRAIELTASAELPDDLVADYTARRRAAGKKAFIDGPHFELPKDRYL